MIGNLKIILKECLVGVFHFLLTLIFVLVLFFFSGISGLTFVSTLMDFNLLLNIIFVIIATLVTTKLMGKQFKEVSSVRRVLFGVSIFPLSVMILAVSVEILFGSNILVIASIVLSAFCYIGVTYFFGLRSGK